MPTNKNAFTRIVILDKLLANRYRKYSIQDLTDRVNDELVELGFEENSVTRRCIEKDIKYLEEKFPLSTSIEFERSYTVGEDKNGNPYSKRCIRYKDPTFSIFHEKLSEDEKGLLSATLSTLGSFDGLAEFGWLDDFCKRLGLVEQKPVILMSKNLNENKNIIAQTFSAIRAQSVIRLHYHTFADSAIRQAIISPYLLKEYNRRWYIIGAAYDTGKILNFALDRILAIQVLPEYEYKPSPDDLNERYEDIVGITYNEESPLYEIVFWISDTSAPYIRTKPLHGSQKELKRETAEAIREKFDLPDYGAIFSIECRENYELIRELTNFDDLKVISPQPIVKAVKEKILKLHKNYF